ncbi:hypothetical protein LINPERPRIM_LOCUS23241 [Linum perenne]
MTSRTGRSTKWRELSDCLLDQFSSCETLVILWRYDEARRTEYQCQPSSITSHHSFRKFLLILEDMALYVEINC